MARCDANHCLFRPRPLELTAADEITAIENVDVLRSNGFEVSVNEEASVGQRLHLTAQPQSKGTVFDMRGTSCFASCDIVWTLMRQRL